ncbi:MAG TPA: hypothetical protein VER03_11485 [Bryobacteraceae bacterium]|nr:hypothetical protein [Bryobacteraceae bacterium]
MATQKQIEANRRNAQKSTGPVTDLGKAVAKFNALKHGMTASTAVLPHEDPSSYAELREAFVATYNPANAVEASLVQVIANSYWRLLRARRAETAAFDLEIRGLKRRNDISDAVNLDNDDEALAVVIAVKEDTLQNIERHTTKIERAYFGAIETLRKVQKDRLREERLTTARPSRQIAFDSQPEPEPQEELVPAATATLTLVKAAKAGQTASTQSTQTKKDFQNQEGKEEWCG